MHHLSVLESEDLIGVDPVIRDAQRRHSYGDVNPKGMAGISGGIIRWIFMAQDFGLGAKGSATMVRFIGWTASVVVMLH